MNDGITDEMLMKDIELTSKESYAYMMLWSGYTILSELPENIDSGNSALYKVQATKNQSRFRRCTDFLHKLEALAEERGLTWNE